MEKEAKKIINGEIDICDKWLLCLWRLVCVELVEPKLVKTFSTCNTEQYSFLEWE
jgi:hypothetical protein